MLGIAALVVAGLAVGKWATWPDVAALASANPETTAFVERWRTREIAAGGSGKVSLRFLPLSRIDEDLPHAVLVAEDIEFFSHHGFATGEIKLALEQAWEKRELPRGASTITQQLAKNLWLSPSRTPWRKLEEALLTRQLEQHLSKRRILELYLNVVEFGPGVWGADNAARRYFGRSASSLSERQAAELAAGLPKPSTWHPGSTSRVYHRRVERILGRMEKTAWLQRELQQIAP